ncbi:NB-ARC domains-containing protein [Tanacetum coccineum]
MLPLLHIRLLSIKIDLFSFIRTADPTKVRVGERQRTEGKPKLLDTTAGRVVPLLPVAPARASSELEASVDKLFDEGGSGGQTEQGDSASGGHGVGILQVSETAEIVAEDAAPVQPRSQRKRKTIVSDAGGPSHPPKKLKEDQETSTGPSVAGKSRSVLQRLLAGAVLNPEVGIAALPTLPFITSYVSVTPERESEDQTDSMAGANLRTITAPPRFVISSDSSHHSGANITEAKVDSFARPSFPLMTVVSTVTSTVDPATTVKEKFIEYSIFGGDSSGGGADHTIGGFSDLTGSDFIVGGIRTVISPDVNLQKVYVPQWSVTIGSHLDDGRAARQMSLSAEVRMRAEYNIRERRRLNFIVEEKSSLLKARDAEIESLKAQLLVKEEEAVKAICLRAEASKFEAIEKSLQGEVIVLKYYNTTLEKEKSELDVKVVDLVASVKVREQEAADLDAMVTSVKSQNDNLVDQEKVTAYENCMGKLEEFQDEQISSNIISGHILFVHGHIPTIASTLIEVVFQKLANEAVKQVVRAKGIHSELKKLGRTLSRIQELLNDASNKEITNEAVQVWLTDLQHLAYDIDNILDDLATKAMCNELTDQSRASTSKIRKLIPACCINFSLSTMLYPKLDNITNKLQDLEKEKESLGLMVKSGSLQVKDDRPKDKNKQSKTSLVDPSRIVGRQGDKDALVLKLLVDGPRNSENFSIVPIVGMGGVGKTALAKSLYDDEKSVTGETKEFKDLNLLQVALRDQLRGKLFLLVLDDVWSESSDDWESLVAPLSACAPGSKIIMTTRKEKLLRELGCGKLNHLQSLLPDDARRLFAQHALGEDNFDSHPRLKAHSEGIVRKCNGLPFALKARGRLLRGKEEEVEWKELLFAYCSLFPKDYAFDKEDLVLLWMAEGFLHQVSSSTSTKKRFGQKCFDELLSRSFFQDSPNDESLFVMHDLMNGLATFVAGDFYFRLEKELGKNAGRQALDMCRHMSFVCEEYVAYKKFEGIEGNKGLRTFLVGVGVKEWWQSGYLSSKILVDLLPELQFLKNLHGKVSIEGLEKVKNATEAREANLSQKRLTKLEVEWSDISYASRKVTIENDVLDALKPYNDCLEKLGIANYLGLEFPKWVGDSSFRQLARVSIRGCKKCTFLPPLGQLESLKELSIQDMGDVEVVGLEFFGVGLAFPSLESLSFQNMWGWKVWSTNGRSGVADSVFPCLQELKIEFCPNLVDVILKAPLLSLKGLTISNCGDGLMRSLVHVAPSVTKLEIESISGLTNDVWRGVMLHLKALEELYVKYCHKIRYLWESKEAEASSKVLVNLRKLKVREYKNMVSLGEKDEEDNYGSNLLTSLSSLEVWRCENFKHLSCPNNIKSLKIYGCNSMACVSFSKGGGQKLKSIFIHGSKKVLLKEELELGEGGEKNIHKW